MYGSIRGVWRMTTNHLVRIPQILSPAELWQPWQPWFWDVWVILNWFWIHLYTVRGRGGGGEVKTAKKGLHNILMLPNFLRPYNPIHYLPLFQSTSTTVILKPLNQTKHVLQFFKLPNICYRLSMIHTTKGILPRKLKAGISSCNFFRRKNVFLRSKIKSEPTGRG